MEQLKTKRYSLHVQNNEFVEEIEGLFNDNKKYFLSMNAFLCEMIKKGLEEFKRESQEVEEILHGKQFTKNINEMLSLMKELFEYLQFTNKLTNGNIDINQKLLCRIYNYDMNELNSIRLPESLYSKGIYDVLPGLLRGQKEVLADE